MHSPPFYATWYKETLHISIFRPPPIPRHFSIVDRIYLFCLNSFCYLRSKKRSMEDNASALHITVVLVGQLIFQIQPAHVFRGQFNSESGEGCARL